MVQSVYNILRMLEKLFTSRDRIKLLSLMLLNPDAEYYGRQLEKLTGANQRNIWRELNSLEKIGLLSSRREANLKHYRINRQFPIYDELRSIFLKTSGIGDLLREDLESVGKTEAAFIYGSVARGTDEIGSDVDLFILGKIDQTKLNRRLAARELTLGRNINYSAMDRDEFARRLQERDPFLARILSGEKIMITGADDDLRPITK